MWRFFIGAALILASGATGAEAEVQRGTVNNPIPLPDTIVVTANRKATPLREVASSITVITREEIAQRQTEMVADMLRDVPGLDVVQSGGTGKITSVFLRGANSHQTLLLVDGVEINDPASPNGSFDFGSLNVGNIERIEILRGSQSVLYGSDAIGGVIQIFTKRGFGKPRVELDVEAGAYDSFHESVHVTGMVGRLDYSLFLSRKDSDGFSASNEKLGSTEKDGFENTELSTKVGLTLSDAYELSVSGKAVDAETDIDKTSDILDDPNASNETETRHLIVTFDKYRPGGLWTPKVTMSLSSFELRSVDDIDSNHPDEASQYWSDGTRVKLETQHSIHLLQNGTLTLGVETEEEQFESSLQSQSTWGQITDTVDEVDSRTSSVYALGEYSVSDRWFATAGVRYDYHDQFKGIATYRLTSAYIFSGLGLRLKGSLGTGFKSPALFQLYHELYGNPELSPEKSTGWEIGFEKSLYRDQVSIGLTYFDTELEDLIAYDAATFKSANILEASSQGIEAFGAYRSGNTAIRVDYTHTDVENRSDGTPIIRRPKNKLGITATHSLNGRLKTSIRLSYVGARDDLDFRTFPAALVSLDSYTLVRLSVAYDLLEWLQLRGRIHNLLDEDYEEVFTYGTSSRAVYVGARVTIR